MVKDWDRLGEGLPYLPEEWSDVQNRFAFDDADLAEIKVKPECNTNAKRLDKLLEKWADMSRYHTVEVLANVLRKYLKQGKLADHLPLLRQNECDEKVKVFDFTEFFREKYSNGMK